MADSILNNLAKIEALYLPGIGHVYDQNDTDPTPDVVTLGADGLPVLIHVDPYQATYDTDTGSGRVPTFGPSANTNDRSTILAVLLIRPLQTNKIGVAQALARPFARYAYKDLIRQHNTLKVGSTSAVWRAVCADMKAGSFTWGSDVPNWYAVQFTVLVDDDRQVAPGN